MEYPLIPETLSIITFSSLVLLSCFTSMLSASVGIGGGTALLAVMAQVIPIKAMIPVHGAIQLGSNFGRAAVLSPQVNWLMVVWFLTGSLLGALIGGQIVVTLPVTILKLTLGLFILVSVWTPTVSGSTGDIRRLVGMGFLSTLLTMFVGATGPFVIALIKSFKLTPPSVVATSAACLVIQHLLKVMVFGLLGFAFAPYALLIILMVLSGLIGTFIGAKLLLKVDEKKFKRWLDILLTALALRLVIVSVINI